MAGESSGSSTLDHDSVWLFVTSHFCLAMVVSLRSLSVSTAALDATRKSVDTNQKTFRLN
jgi:hypothetical protein